MYICDNSHDFSYNGLIHCSHTQTRHIMINQRLRIISFYLQAIDDVNTLEADLNNYRSKLESVLQTEVLSKNRESDWERELMESAQRLQEADTKVGGLERMLQERESLSQLLTAERDEAREILANREMEKIVS